MIFKHTAVSPTRGVQFAKGLPLDEHGVSYISPKKGISLKGHHSPAGEVITPTSKLIRDTNGPKLSGYQINFEAVNRLREKIKAGVTGSQIESELRQEIERLKLDMQDLRSNSASEREVQRVLQLRLHSYEDELTLLKRDHSILEQKAAQSEKAEHDKVGLQSSYDKLTEAYRELAKERDALQSRLDLSAPSLIKEIDGEVEKSRLELAHDRMRELNDLLRQVEADKLRAERDAAELRMKLREEIAKSADVVADLKVELEAIDEERKGLGQQVGRLQEKINRNEAALEISNQAVNAMSTLLKLIAGDTAVSELFTVKPDQDVLELIEHGATTRKKTSEQRLSDGSSGTSDGVPVRQQPHRRTGLGKKGSAVRLSTEDSK